MMRVLGIDPGSRRAGFGCLDWEGARGAPAGGAANAVRAGSGRVRLVAAGVFDLGSSSLPIGQRLLQLAERLERTIRELEPEVLAVEEAFAGRGPQAALRLGEARGVVLLTAARLGLPVAQYPPATVKRRVAGSGRAAKPALARLVAARLGLAGPPPWPLDASDALAVALCHGLVRAAELLLPESGAQRAGAGGRRRAPSSDGIDPGP